VAWAADATWWMWDDGSAPIYWRWPVHYREVMRDGLWVHFWGTPPWYRNAQHDSKDPGEKKLVVEKLMKVQRQYIASGYVVSLTSFFPVPKGGG
jgi:hypothetical protein